MMIGSPADGTPDNPASGAVFVYERQSQSTPWRLTDRIVIPPERSGGRIGSSISLDGDRVVVGAELDRSQVAGSSGFPQTGSAHVFELDGGEWIHVAGLLADDRADGDLFGHSVLQLGEQIIVGAPGNDEQGDDAGAAYFFERVDGSWQQVDKLVPGTGQGGAEFGKALVSDGNELAVGSPGLIEDQRIGAVVFYEQTSGEWQEMHRIQPEFVMTFEEFGFALSLDGDRLAVGAPGARPESFVAGVVYVFERIEGGWELAQAVKGLGLSFSDRFGSEISVLGDVLAVGAPTDDRYTSRGRVFMYARNSGDFILADALESSSTRGYERFGSSLTLAGGDLFATAPEESNSNGYRAGAAYRFAMGDTGWELQDRYIPGPGNENDRFGDAVGLDGRRAIVGVSGADHVVPAVGEAFIFEYSEGAWSEQAHLIPPEPAEYARFGWSVSIEGDVAVVGSEGAETEVANSSGAVYVYAFRDGDWVLEARIDPPAGLLGAFGHAVEIHGSRIFISAPYTDAPFGVIEGSVFIYEEVAGEWALSAELIPSEDDDADNFGMSLSVDGDRILVGADRIGDFPAREGAAYLFEYDGMEWSEIGKFRPDDLQLQDAFGRNVQLAGDWFAVSAEQQSAGVARGVVYVYRLIDDDWLLHQKITPDRGERDYGLAIALHEERLLIAAPNYWVDSMEPVDGIWTRQHRLLPEGFDLATNPGGYAYALAMTSDLILVGSPYASRDGLYSGAVFVHSLNEAPSAGTDLVPAIEDNPIQANVLLDNGDGADFDPEGDAFWLTGAGAFEADGIGGSVVLADNGDFSYTPPTDAFGTASFSYGLIDEFLGRSSGQVTIEVLPVNDPPSFQADSIAPLLEDSGAVTVAKWASFEPGAANELQQVLEYRVSGVTQPGLFSSLPFVAPDGTLSFSLADDANGSSDFEVAVRDDGGQNQGGSDLSDYASFSIEVQPVNDPPDFAGLGNLRFPQSASYSSLWAFGISAGPADEANQQVNFEIVSNTNPDLFGSGPTIDPDGRLRLEGGDQAVGSAVLQVVAVDSGGVANGGANQSNAIELRIEFLPLALTTDLMIDKTSGRFSVDLGDTLSYLILIENAGPGNALGALVSDVPPTALSDVQWTCIAEGGAACPPSGTDLIEHYVDLPAGASVAFQLEGVLVEDIEPTITNTASVVAPQAMLELDVSNNQDSDTDVIGLFSDSMESVEP